MTVRINLLPWREELRSERQKEFFFVLGSAAILAVLLAFLLHTQFARQIDKQNRKNAFIQQHITQLNQQIKEIETLEEKREALKARMDVIQRLQGNRIQIVQLFDEMVRLVPEGVYLTKVGRTDNRLTINGIAESNIRISSLLRNFDNSTWFETPVLTGIESGESAMLAFSLMVNHQLPKKDESETQ